jgi:hypothetical protein
MNAFCFYGFMRFCLALVFGVCLLCAVGEWPIRADIISMKGGKVIRGTIVQTNNDEMLVLGNYDTVECALEEIRSVKPENNVGGAPVSTNSLIGAQRFLDWRGIITNLVSQTWSGKLRQVPAMVVTNGMLRNVPYVSFRSGLDYEVNIYGDLDKPAGVELGVFHDAATSLQAKDNGIDFVASIPILEEDRAAVKNLNHAIDLLEQDDLRYEIKPVSAEDSKGGWWVSAFDPKALEKARVSEVELGRISVVDNVANESANGTNQGRVYVRCYQRKLADGRSENAATNVGAIKTNLVGFPDKLHPMRR